MFVFLLTVHSLEHHAKIIIMTHRMRHKLQVSAATELCNAAVFSIKLYRLQNNGWLNESPIIIKSTSIIILIMHGRFL